MQSKRDARFWLVAIALIGLALAHGFMGYQPAQVASPLMILDRLFDLLLVASIAMLSIGIGRITLRKFGWHSVVLVEEGVFAFGVGAGLTSLVLLFLGFLGLLYAPLLWAILIAGIVATQSEWRGLISDARARWSQQVPFTRGERWLIMALVALVLPIVFSALLPPTDADALSYHLVAPSQFLKRHTVFASFDNIGINYPIAVDLLYVLGLAAGSDIAAQLAHTLFGLMLTAGIYAFATRYFSRQIALLALVVWWTLSIAGLEASTPIIDLAWTGYEFLALYALLRWRDSYHGSDLLLAGAAMGFAISNKYLGAIGLIVAVILVVWESVRLPHDRLRAFVRNTLIFSLPVIVLAGAWYLKNALWLGNPIYPFFSGNYGLDGQLRRDNSDLGAWIGLGLGNDWIALLMFPWNVYMRWEYFNAAFNRGGPSLFFLCLPFYLIAPKSRWINFLLVVCAVRFAVWWEYIQNTRYLLVIFPWLAIISAYIVGSLFERWRRPSVRLGIALIVVIFALVGIVMQWGFFLVMRVDSIGFLSGVVSRDVYLQSNLHDYRATQFVNTQLSANAKILAIGGARVYYVQRAVIPDESHDNWIYLLNTRGTDENIAARMHELGITHLWVSEPDLDYFREYWKIPGLESQAHRFDTFRSLYLETLYTDERGHSIYAFIR